MEGNLLYHSRKIGLNKLAAFAEDDINSECVENVVDKKTWELFCVSRLFNFEPSEEKLRFYNKKLREMVAANLKHDMVAKIHAEIAVINEFATTTFDHEAISIEVQVQEIQTDEQRKPRVFIYKGYMLSRGKLNSQDVEPQLPLLMCRSKNINLISSVHMCLAALFDCRVSKLELRQVDLQWILAILLENDPEIKDQCIDFTLTYQPHTSPKDKVSIGMSALALQKIWRCIRSKNIKETEADFDEVALLFSSVGQHIQATFNLQVEHMGLTGLSSTFGNFLSTGKVIFTSMEVAEVILRFLTNQLLLEEKFGVELFSKQERMEACNT